QKLGIEEWRLVRRLVTTSAVADGERSRASARNGPRLDGPKTSAALNAARLSGTLVEPSDADSHVRWCERRGGRPLLLLDFRPNPDTLGFVLRATARKASRQASPGRALTTDDAKLRTLGVA